MSGREHPLFPLPLLFSFVMNAGHKDTPFVCRRAYTLKGKGKPLRKEQKTLEKEQWLKSAWDMLYLVRCGINAMKPDPVRVAAMDLEKVYTRSKSQSLDVLTCMALESLLKSNPKIQIQDENRVLPQWEEAKNKAIAKNLMMDTAREQLFSFLEERGIWHMALKGAVLSSMYPRYGMRQMADNDILFDASFRQEVHDWFIEQGYVVESFQKNNHDIYLKKPVYNFEMHTALFDPMEQPGLAQYYLTIQEKLIQKAGTRSEYCMADEDFYLYIVAHEYKHYLNRGTGLRSLLDLYVCNQIQDKMDRRYLDKELNKMGLSEFECEMRQLAQKVLDREDRLETLTEKEEDALKKVIYGSTYGTIEGYWNNCLRKMQANGDKISISVKCRYMIGRLAPNRTQMNEWCQQHAPYFLKHQWLMPLAPVWRIIKKAKKDKGNIREEWDTIKKA